MQPMSYIHCFLYSNIFNSTINTNLSKINIVSIKEGVLN